MTRPLDERGFVLVLVLWALLLLSAVGTGVALSAREGSWLVGGHAQRAEARWAADAGLAASEARLAAWVEALAALPDAEAMRSGQPALDSATSARRRVWIEALNALDTQLAGRGEETLPNGAAYRVSAWDATARLNLNAAGEPELRGFFARWILDERDLAILVHSLLDWRDADDLPRLHGAEAGHYARLPVPYPIRNGPLVTVRELLLVRGMTPELFRAVEPFVAVLPDDRLRINVNGAPPEVLAAVPGFSLELAQRLVARRQRGRPVLSAAEIGSDPDLAPWFDRAAGSLALGVIAVFPERVAIESLGRAGGAGPEHRVQALYALAGGTATRLERREVGP